jgi:hypothetical protein
MLIAATCCAALMLAPCAGATDKAGELPWKTVAASGEVLSRSNLAPEDAWEKVRRGNSYESLTYMRTGKRGKATFAQERHILIVRSNSSLRLPQIDSADPDSQVFQDSGRVTYEVDGSQTDHFEVVTPYLIAGVKGTVFTVEVTGQSAKVHVVEGVVEVSSRFRELSVELQAGEEVLVDAEETDRLEIRQAERVIVEKTRREVRFARQKVSDADPARIRVASVDEVEPDAAEEADPIDEPAGSGNFDDPKFGDIIDKEAGDDRSMSVDDVEKISREEMKDLDSKKARLNDAAAAESRN